MNVKYSGKKEVKREDCMLCGAKQPPGHVLVRTADGTKREGRVCSSHTLWEVISDSRGRFMVEITVDPGPHHFTDALERVHAKHGVPYGKWL